jgi:hypothetical protein
MPALATATTTTTTTVFEPTAEDIGRVVNQLERSWNATITIRRKSRDDVGYRDIYVAIDGEEIAILHAGEEVSRDVKPGRHRLKAHNTLFRKTLDVNLSPGEHATFTVVNKAGFGTYSVLAFFLGGGPLYLTFERDTSNA